MVYIPNVGLEYLARYITQSTAGYFAWMALDAGATSEAAGTTALTTEITTNGGARALATVAYEADYKATWVKAFTFTGNLTIKGMGIFNSITPAGSKVLLVHAYASDRNVANLETCTITQKLAFARV